MVASSQRILTLNSGSSSLKFALYRMDAGEALLVTGSLERIGLSEGTFQARDGQRQRLIDECIPLADHVAALQRLFDWLRGHLQNEPLAAAGHRIVHGGATFTRPQGITPELLQTLRTLVPLAPNHLPSEIACIEAVARALPSLPQVACFDTAFHRAMPAVAQTYPLPQAIREAGVIRYGFHGLSYEYIVEELRRIDPQAADGRLVIAHLGNGASLAAVHQGRCVDTTMGLTPLGGLVMGTRCGDLDPGIVLYLLREKDLPIGQVDQLLNKQSGLLGLSGSSSDMKDLLDEATDPKAALAVEVFCRQASKHAAAMAASLGGLDTLIFTAGIGEHAAPVRERMAARLAFLGLQLDPQRNAAHAPVISTGDSRVTVRVMPTNEELMIARQTWRCV